MEELAAYLGERRTILGRDGVVVEKIRLGLSTRNVVLMPFYYARDKKLFDKYGLDVEIIQIRSNLQLAGLVAGELDFITGIGTAIEGIGKGMPLKAVAVLYRAPLFSLLSQLPNAKALEGKKISVSRIGSESHFNGVVMLEKSGVDPKKVTWIQTGNTALNMLALERGLVEGRFSARRSPGSWRARVLKFSGGAGT